MLDNELSVEIPEHVELQFVLASVGNRFLACAIDHIIQLLMIFFIIFAARSFQVTLSALEMQWGTNWFVAGAILIVFLITFGYFVLFETVWSGQTPGKRWLRLRVMRQDGRPIGFYEAMVRNLVRLVDIMPFPSYFVGIVSIFFSREYRRLGDYAAGTVVVKERSSEAPRFSELFEDEAAFPERESDTAMPNITIPPHALRLITNEEMRAVDAFLKRRTRLGLERRRFLAHRIAAPLMLKLHLSDRAVDYETFLEVLHREYARRAKYL